MSKITDIQPQKRNKNRVNVYVDGEYVMALELLTVMKLGLKIGNEVTESDLIEAAADTERSVALERAMNYISRGSKTSYQLNKYLADKGFGADVVQYVADKMKYYGYIDDAAYAETYARLNEQGKGSRRIKAELIQRGISAAYAEKYSAQDEEQTRDNAKTLAERFMRGKTADVKNLQRLQRYLVSRGYDFDVVNGIVREYRLSLDASEREDYD